MAASPSAEPKLGLAGRLARLFIESRLTVLFVLGAVLLGVVAVQLTPREEEPQIVVPMVDVAVPLPGASAREVESQVTTPLERQLWGIPGVEYVYSTSEAGQALITVRFKVNQPLEPSVVKVRQELAAHPELLPSAAQPPTVRVLSVDDVPFMTLTLHGDQPPGVLRQLGETVARQLAEVPDTAQVHVVGGARRQVRVEPDPDKLRSAGVTFAQLRQALQAADADLPAGAAVAHDQRTTLEADALVRSASELERLVVASPNGHPVYLSDVATVRDGPEPEPAIALFASKQGQGFEPAVTISVAKRIGANATALAGQVDKKLETLHGTIVPRSVGVSVTRNYGETAGEKSTELIEHLLIATVSVIALILVAMGWRSAVVVGITVPVTLALTLLLSYLLGYTLNRVTLFALIFSIGILVDDAIVVMENIHRHLHLPDRKKGLVRTVIDAVDEVGNPTILATFAVIAAILPMAFVRGLMGPYMRPIPVGASLAMLFSLVIAFVVSPWASLKLFGRRQKHAKPEHHEEPAREGKPTRAYRWLMRHLLASAPARWGFLGAVVALFVGAASLVATGHVKVKMLPFDNKSEFQVQLDLPPGTPQQDALAAGQRLARRLLQEPEVHDVEVYSGDAAPFTFVGLVRHSFLRSAPEQVDLQVNLVPKGERKAQSHAIVTRLRPELEQITGPLHARMKLVEIPPGPPVLDTMVAEVYGPDATSRDALAGKVRELFQTTPGLVDIDSSLNETAPRDRLVVDREKAALHGVAPASVAQVLSLAGQGQALGAFHVEGGSTQVPVVMQLPVGQRSDTRNLLALEVPGARGPVPLGELVRVESGREDRPIFHKNLMPVSYVFGDLAKQIESPVYALSALNAKLDDLEHATGEHIERYGLSHPLDTEHRSLKWDGEWHVTLEVFRDLGLAFAAVLVLIFVMVVGWFESFSVPWVILVPIPLSLIGILPAHMLLGAFFTATSMIGFIAGAGIIVRNSIILVDFIELKVREGLPLAKAVEEAGVVRFRPMLLTAAAVLVGSAVMLADPIFQGLAISLMAGEVAATLLSRIAVPVLYFVVARRGRAAQLARETPPVTPTPAAEMPGLQELHA
ncbi:MAG: efflux RND transporter permease subunit [Deltaproteobacteria bacterium]|nr:efflux RND transporter permease subunit [Deltaproteobacteria bacterium]